MDLALNKSPSPSVHKLVGARKRKPTSISKIIPSSYYDEGNSDSEQEEKPNKLKSILDELKQNKNFSNVYKPPLLNVLSPVSGTHIKSGNSKKDDLQDEPLDLSVDAVDLSITNNNKNVIHKSNQGDLNEANMLLFYQNYFFNHHGQNNPGSNIPSQMLLGKRVVSSQPPPEIYQSEVTLGTIGHQMAHPKVCIGLPRQPTSSTKSYPPLVSMDLFNHHKKSLTAPINDHVSSSKSNASLGEKAVSKEKSSNKKLDKPKQRRYRTERPFACPHCPARFTLRSNMERHGKHQHASVWQRSPSNRVLNKQKLLQEKDELYVSSPVEQKSSVRAALSSKLKRKLSETVSSSSSSSSSSEETVVNELASVEKLLKLESGFDHQEVNQEENENEEEEEEDDEDEEVNSDDESEEIVTNNNKKTSAYSSAPHKISCPHCSRRFPWTSSLRRHLLTHTGQKPYQCSKCPLLFTTKSNCDRHLVRKHNNNNSSNNQEVNNENNDEEDEEEEEEEEGFLKVNEEHDPDNSIPTFRCHLCESISSPSRSELLRHLETTHPEIYKEQKDNITLVNNDQQQHSISNRKVLCAICLRRFWSVEDLRRHIRSHTGERPFSCKFCSRRFTLKHSMLRHLKKHN